MLEVWLGLGPITCRLCFNKPRLNNRLGDRKKKQEYCRLPFTQAPWASLVEAVGSREGSSSCTCVWFRGMKRTIGRHDGMLRDQVDQRGRIILRLLDDVYFVPADFEAGISA